MIFMTAIADHQQYVKDLESYLKGHGQVHPKDIKIETACTLGAWIHGEGLAFAGTPEFHALKIVHRAFHEKAALIAESIAHQHKKEASEALEHQSSLHTFLRELTDALNAMESVVKKAD